MIQTFWEDAVELARTLAADTRLKHKVTAVWDMRPSDQIGDPPDALEYGVVGWQVDLADSEQVVAIDHVDVEPVAEVIPLRSTLDCSITDLIGDRGTPMVGTADDDFWSTQFTEPTA